MGQRSDPLNPQATRIPASQLRLQARSSHRARSRRLRCPPPGRTKPCSSDPRGPRQTRRAPASPPPAPCGLRWGPRPQEPAGGCASPRAGPPEPCAPSAAARRPAWSPARPRSDSLCAPRPAGGGRRRRPEAEERRHGTGASGRGRRADGRGKQGLRLGSLKRDHVDPTAFRTQVSDRAGGRVRGGCVGAGLGLLLTVANRGTVSRLPESARVVHPKPRSAVACWLLRPDRERPGAAVLLRFASRVGSRQGRSPQ